ncbi:MAG: TIGR03067 domain-containing protein [Planctomycetaceae bacterium]|nr:TIGR03067 domain-containing protein [Planctomycetaceae bacterium]
MLFRLSLLTVFPLFFVSGLLAETQQELQPFQGAWKVVELTDSGVNIPREDFPQLLQSGGSFRIEDDQIMFHSVVDGRLYSKTLQVDNKHTPPHFNVRMDKETTGWGIYRLEGDQITVCMSSQSATDRPEEFSSDRDSDHVLMVLQKYTTQPNAIAKDDGIKITPRDPSKPSLAQESDEPKKKKKEAKPIKEQDLIPTDLKLALALVGTWKFPQEIGPFYLSLNPDGTFVTSPAVPINFTLIFFNVPVSTGRWTVKNGVLELVISNSIHSQRVGAGVEYVIQNLNRENLRLTSHLGASVGAVRVR